MDAEAPSISVRLNHLRFACQVRFLVLDFPIPHLGLEVAGKLDPVRRVDVDHLDLARQVLASRQRRHDLQTVAQDQPIGPVHVMLVELDGLVVLLLRVREQRAVHVLARRDLQDRLCAHALVDVERDRIDSERARIPLARPLQPGFVYAQRLREHPRLGLRQLALTGGRQQLRQPISSASRIESQFRRSARAVRVLSLRNERHVPFGSDLGGRVVLAGRLGEPVIGHLVESAVGQNRLCLLLVRHILQDNPLILSVNNGEPGRAPRE